MHGMATSIAAECSGQAGLSVSLASLLPMRVGYC
jgi:hypothetical protein